MGTPKSKKKSIAKPQKTIFVIMPFTCANERNKEELTAFFEDNIKKPIESNKKFKNRYSVRRSDDTFNITKQIILDLFTADIVICDLSGKDANPNVMYELGIRMALSNKPVILIREKYKENQIIFDISGFYTFMYNPKIPRQATDHICQKLDSLEGEREKYTSPLLDIIKDEVPLLRRESRNRAIHLLRVLEKSIKAIWYGYSAGVAGTYGYEESVISEYQGEIDKLLATVAQPKKSSGNVILRLTGTPVPAIEGYLTTQYLTGLVPVDIENKFTNAIMLYHISYFGFVDKADARVPSAIQRFVDESRRIVDMCSCLLSALQTSDISETDNAYETFRKLFGSFWTVHESQSSTPIKD